MIRLISPIRPISRAAVLGRTGAARQLLLASGIGLISLIGLIAAPKTASALGLVRPPNNLGLVGYWSMDDGNGTTVTDFSGNGNRCTRSGSPPWVTGKRGYALYFGGSSQTINCGSAASIDDIETQGGGGFSTAFWYKPDSATANYSMLVKGPNWTATTSNGGWNVSQNTAGQLYFQKSYDTTILRRTSNAVVVAGVWQYVVVTWDGSATATNLKIYYNGAELSSYAVTTDGVGNKVSDAAATLSIPSMTGAVDEVRIYNRALSATEVSDLYGQSSKVTKLKNAARGLVAYYPMSEGTGTTTADATGQGNTGTLTGGPTWAGGKFGNGLSLDGTDDYVDLATPSALQPSSALTVSAWVQRSGSLANFSGVVSSIKSTGNGGGYILVGTSANQIRFYIDTSGGGVWASATSNSAINANQWYFIVGTWDGSTVRLYVNGVLQSNTGSANTIVYSTGVSARIGLYGFSSPNDKYWPGLIDDVRIYNRALSADEISGLYASSMEGGGFSTIKVSTSQNTIAPSSLVGWWTFDGPDLNTTTSTDRSGQGNNGTLSGGPAPRLGKVGQALYFDGTNDQITVADNSLFNGSSTSISAWVKRNSTSGERIVYSNAAGSSGYGVGFNGTGLRWLSIGSGLSSSPSASGTYNDTQDWHHYVWVADAVNLYIYYDGAQVLSTAGVINSVGSTKRIGSTNSRFLAGSLDDLRVYNKALSATEVLALYNQGK